MSLYSYEEICKGCIHSVFHKFSGVWVECKEKHKDKVNGYNGTCRFKTLASELKEEKNISHKYKKYSEFINYNNCSNEYIQLYTDIINSLKENKTIIILPHRLSTLKNCDKI